MNDLAPVLLKGQIIRFTVLVHDRKRHAKSPQRIAMLNRHRVVVGDEHAGLVEAGQLLKHLRILHAARYRERLGRGRSPVSALPQLLSDPWREGGINDDAEAQAASASSTSFS